MVRIKRFIDEPFGGAVDVDNQTIEYGTDNKLRVKDLGITTSKIADLAITAPKIADDSVTIHKLSSPTIPFSLSYAMIKNMVTFSYDLSPDHRVFITTFSIADAKMRTISGDYVRHYVRMNMTNRSGYTFESGSENPYIDEHIVKWSSGLTTSIGHSGRNIGAGNFFYHEPQASGSSLIFYVDGVARVSVTDSAFASGSWGVGTASNVSYARQTADAMFVSPSSQIPSALYVLELDIIGSGSEDDPYRPLFSQNLVEIKDLPKLPAFLYLEAEKYYFLKSKGLTDEEIKEGLGYIPQHQVDLDSVAWGTFEFFPDKGSTVIVTIKDDNFYKSGAIDRQKNVAKSVFKSPKDYKEAFELFNTLKKDHPEWLAGKDNFAYQTLGLEIFGYFQSVDFYYGELFEHKTHYKQLKEVNEKEIENRLNELIHNLEKQNVLIDERDKHIAKAKEILKKGW